MRDYKGMKRQRGRNRSGGQGQSQGGGKPGQNANRAFDSNGPDNIKVRGHAQHVYEKYNQLARDAAAAGDRVLAENHLQHAEHYFRTLRVLQPNRPVTEIVGRDTFVNGFDLDFEDEALESAMAEADATAAAGGAPVAQTEGEAQSGGEARAERSDRQGGERFGSDRQGDGQRREYRQDRNNGGASDRPRFDRQARWEDRGQGDGRQNGERQNGERQTGERTVDARQEPRQGEGRQDRQGGDRSERPRYERQPRWDDRGDRGGEPVDTAAMVAPPSAAPPASTFEPQPFESSVRESARVLRSEDGGVSEAPAFLSSAAPQPSAEDGEPRRVRTRRPRRRAEGEPVVGDEGSSEEG